MKQSLKLKKRGGLFFSKKIRRRSSRQRKQLFGIWKNGRPTVGFIVFVVVFALIGAKLFNPFTKAEGTHPNIVVIMTDDQSIDSLKYYMPQLNARSQTAGWWNFTQAVANTPLCGPSRATFFTGELVDHHGMNCNDPPGTVCPIYLNARTKMMPVWMKNAGYTTSLSGKWFNWYPCGSETKKANYAAPPGWDDWHGLASDFAYNGNFKLVEHNQQVTYARIADDTDYGTYVTGNDANNAVNNCTGQCFIYWGPSAPHQPGTNPVDYNPAEVVPGLTEYLPNWNEGCPGAADPSIADKPAALQTTKCLGKTWKRSKYQGTLQAVDHKMTQMLASIQAKGLDSNTIIIFTSDHGQQLGSHRWTDKEVPYEESERIPMMVYVPGTTGGSIDRLVSMMDLTATIADYANATPLLPQDGISFRPLIEGTSTGIRNDVYIEHTGIQVGAPVKPWKSLRQDCIVNNPCYKLVKYSYKDVNNVPQVEWELFNLTADPYEFTNLLPNTVTGYAGQPGWNDSNPTVATLKARLNQMMTDGR